MKVIYKKIEYEEGDIIQWDEGDNIIRKKKLKFGKYPDHEGYCQYNHFGWYIKDGLYNMTLPDVIDMYHGKKVDKI